MYQTEEAVIQNLKDAGCNEDGIACFLNEIHSGRRKEAVKVLEQHRHTLIDDLHSSQKRIDCLDYLIYQMKK